MIINKRKGGAIMVYTPPKISLKAARTNAGYTLSEAASLIGVSVATLHKWENDSSDIKISASKRIEEVYDYPTEFIFFGKTLEFNSSKDREVN